MRLLKIFALLLPGGILILFYASIGFYGRLMGDDFCLLYYADRFGVFRSMWYWYLNWHGGFSASFIDSILVVVGEDSMGIFVPACLLAWLGAITFSFSMIMKNSLDGVFRIMASLSLGSALIAIVLLWSPEIEQSLFWWSGMRGYVMPLVIASLYPGLYLKYVRHDRTNLETFSWNALSFTVLFVAGGFSEIFTPVLLVIVFLAVGIRLLATQFNIKDRPGVFLFSGLLGISFAFLIMVNAPGNAVRQSFFPEPPDFFTLLRIAFDGYSQFLAYIPGSTVMLSAFIGSIIGVVSLGVETRGEGVPSAKIITSALLAAIIIPYLCFLPFAYGMSEPLVGRALTNPAFVFSAFFYYAVFLIGQWLATRITFFQQMTVSLALIIATLAFLLVSVWNQSPYLASMRAAAMEYAKQWDYAYERIAQARQRGDASVVIPVKQNWTGVFEPNDNPKFFVNKCMSDYFEIQILATDASVEQH